ncbi:MAG: amidohydrolase family protein [Prosthecobacter sp.]|uniref:amidohydrolase family protein n=1 Tax=Prosthecobacter sp. TaxID=1965333 RepID=UPI0019F21C70|nr:amidohydrolase family protein [Prosthecobacter sp.]MBE2282509.1 amidohydrolase family protein [Prosthecobacter sp.]
MTSRRHFLATGLGAIASRGFAQTEAVEPVIDIHQHMNYHLRQDDHLLLHQKAMGITTTIILPGGTMVQRPSTHEGRSNGLAAKCLGTAWARDFAQARPGAYLWACNEVTDLDSAPAELEKWLKQGACMIGEQKFMVECDSPHSQKLYELAAAYNVPILLHFQHQTYNLGYDRLHTMLEKFPKTHFIGHAQAFWGNIDKNHDQKVNYPKGKVTPGGLTDRYLADYPNMFADMSAGSGLLALTRDEEHTTAFFQRHQDKILYGSDCADHLGRGPGCQGAATIAAIRKLAPSKAVERKILFENSKKLFRLA